MKAVLHLLICIALVACQRTSVEPGITSRTSDLNSQLQVVKAQLSELLPPAMHIGKAEVSDLPQGRGILLHAFPKDSNHAHPSIAVFLWPETNQTNIAYETSQGAHTFRRIGSSELYRIYYSGPSGNLREEVQQKFCTKERINHQGAPSNGG